MERVHTHPSELIEDFPLFTFSKRGGGAACSGKVFSAYLSSGGIGPGTLHLFSSTHTAYQSQATRPILLAALAWPGEKPPLLQTSGIPGHTARRMSPRSRCRGILGRNDHIDDFAAGAPRCPHGHHFQGHSWPLYLNGKRKTFSAFHYP